MKNSPMANTVNTQGKHKLRTLFIRDKGGNISKSNKVDKHASSHKWDIYKIRNINMHMPANEHLRKQCN